MPDLPTFREWLAARTPTITLLRDYLSTLGEEWLRTEHKAATTDIDAGLRREVVALQNTRGGEVYLGVDRGRNVTGTPVTIERIRQVLSQAEALPVPAACVSDLNLVVTQPLVIADGPLRVVVVEVIRTGKSALFRDQNDRMQFCYRRGDETLEADAAGVIEKYGQRAKEEILITCFRELKALSARVRRWSAIPEIPEPSLPFLSRCMSDGSLYTFLDSEELRQLIGGSAIPNQGVTRGFVDTYLSTVRQARAIFIEAETDMSIMSIDDALRNTHRGYSMGDYQTSLDQQVGAFRSWLLAKGILPE